MTAPAWSVIRALPIPPPAVSLMKPASAVLCAAAGTLKKPLGWSKIRLFQTLNPLSCGVRCMHNGSVNALSMQISARCQLVLTRGSIVVLFSTFSCTLKLSITSSQIKIHVDFSPENHAVAAVITTFDFRNSVLSWI